MTDPIHDGIGSTTATTDQSGSVVGAEDYDAWGNERTHTGFGSRHGWAS
jgi:hypothetical protein